MVSSRGIVYLFGFSVKFSIKFFCNKWIGVFLVGLFLIHGGIYFLPMINLEWVFLNAADFFKEGDLDFLKSYFLL